jgi:Ala-tRNA(Pro) deacylase
VATSAQDLFACLERLGIETRTIRHPPLFTVEQSRALRGDIPGGHSKNLFLKDKKGALYLVVAEEDAEIDLKSLHRLIGSGRLSFGKPDLLREVLGVVPGAVTPFAVINDTGRRVQIFLDAALMRHEVVNFHPLDNSATTAIGRDELIRFLRETGHEPAIIALSQAAAEPQPDIASRRRMAT